MTTLRKDILVKQRYFQVWDTGSDTFSGIIWQFHALEITFGVSASCEPFFQGEGWRITSLFTHHEQYAQASLQKGSLENFTMQYETQAGEEKVYCFRDANILKFRVHWQIFDS